MKKELLFDFETIAVNNLHKATTLELSLFAFDRSRFVSNPYTFDEIVNEALTVKYDSKDMINRHKTIYEKGALDFWLNSDLVSKKRTFLPSEKDLTLEQVIAIVTEYIEKNKITYWWSRSNMFDPVILGGQFQMLGLTDKFKEILNYGKVRDTRSFIDGYFGIEAGATDFTPVTDPSQEPEFNKKFEKHYSRHDIAVDLLRMQLIEQNRHGVI